jgi:hypothetical protein
MVGARPENATRGLSKWRPWSDACDACCDHACCKQHSIRISDCIPLAHIATCALLIDSLDAAVPECCSHTLGHLVRTVSGVLQVG